MLLLAVGVTAHDYPACYRGQIEGPGFISFDNCAQSPGSIVCKDSDSCGLDKCGGPSHGACTCSKCHLHQGVTPPQGLRCGCDGTGCYCDNNCKFGPGGTRWRSLDRAGVTITAKLGPCLGCMCELDSAKFDSAVCEPGAPHFSPPADADLCLGPIGMCAAKGRWVEPSCRVLNFTRGDPMPSGLPDPIATLGSSWVRESDDDGTRVLDETEWASHDLYTQNDTEYVIATDFNACWQIPRIMKTKPIFCHGPFPKAEIGWAEKDWVAGKGSCRQQGFDQGPHDSSANVTGQMDKYQCHFTKWDFAHPLPINERFSQWSKTPSAAQALR